MAKSDRAFRALARTEPDVIATMLKALGHLAPGAVVDPDDVAPTHIDGLPPEMDADWAARVDADELIHAECQGYNDAGFSERVTWYHLGLALRNRGKRRVRTAAMWLMPLPAGQSRRVMRVHDISVRIRTIVLPNVPAVKLLAHPKTACFAAGANPGVWSDDELCTRVAAALREINASWAMRHMAVVAAAMRRRYDAMVTAMEQANLEPIIIEDLVKFGEDRGFDRGRNEGRNEVFERQFARRLGRALTQSERATLKQRLATLGVDRLDDMVLTSTPAALASWLADPAAC